MDGTSSFVPLDLKGLEFSRAIFEEISSPAIGPLFMTRAPVFFEDFLLFRRHCLINETLGNLYTNDQQLVTQSPEAEGYIVKPQSPKVHKSPLLRLSGF